MKSKSRRSVAEKPPHRMKPRGATRLATDRVVPLIKPASEDVLWENELFVVTDEGIAMKPSTTVFFKSPDLPRVAEGVAALVAEYSANPLMQVIDQALRIHHPDEFPDGLKLKSQPKPAAGVKSKIRRPR